MLAFTSRAPWGSWADRRWGDIVTSLMVLGFLLMTLVPVIPVMPSTQLEGWVEAINMAVAQRLQFGADIVFTYGPYASVLTHAFNPSTWGLSLLGGSMYFAGIATATLVLLDSWRRKLLVVAALPLLFGASKSDPANAIFLIAPLLMLLAFSRILLVDRGRESTRDSAVWAQAMVMCATLGLLPAIKVSAAVPVSLAVILMTAVAELANRRRLALAVPLAAATSFLALWLVSGQALTGIGGYVRWSVPISGGFSQAMSIREVGPQSPLATLTFMLAAGLIGVALCWIGKNKHEAVLAAMWGVTAWLVFKEYFVRPDARVSSAWPILAVGILIMTSWKAPRPTLIATVCAVAAHAFVAWPAFDADNVAASYRRAPDDAVAVLRGNAGSGAVARHYAAALERNQKELPLPPLHGSIDTYPWGAPAIFANGLSWSPRPVLESYGAYTESLAELNAKHLSSADAPANIAFGLRTIDGQVPALSDGASWIPLLERYRPNGAAMLYRDQIVLPVQLLIKRDESIHLARGRTARRLAIVGKWIATPRTREGQAVVVRVAMTETFLGRVRDTLWRPPLMFISLQLDDGRTVKRRFIPRIGAGGFVLSPYVDESNRFGELYGSANRRLPRVVRFRIGPDGERDSLFWSTHYRVESQVLGLPRH